MSAMEPSITSQQPAADPSRTRTHTDTDEPYTRHFRSVKMPGVASGPILPESVSKFFRKRFRRTDTHAAR
jgi:hypothetical protein